MENSLSALAVTAVTIGTFHTIVGPDHYLPFVAMSKTRNWSFTKTINIVILCGIGHVFSSIIIGFIGIAAGVALSKLEYIEGFRGNIAAWLLFLFGISYTVWGFYRLIRHSAYHHHHIRNLEQEKKKKMTFWILFTIFIFGPCEPLIPLLMYPAAKHNYFAVAIISGVFAIATISTMLIIVLLMLRGISMVKFNTIEKYQHILAGSAIAICGAGIIFLGL